MSCCPDHDCSTCEVEVICEAKSVLWKVLEDHGIDLVEILLAVQAMYIDVAEDFLEDGDEDNFRVMDANIEVLDRALEEIMMNFEANTVGPKGAQ